MKFTPIITNPFSSNPVPAAFTSVDYSLQFLAKLNRHLRRINHVESQITAFEIEAEPLIRLRDAAKQYSTPAFGPARLKLIGTNGESSHLDITLECDGSGQVKLTTMTEAVHGAI
jgi:hypothetical protein